MKLSLNSSLSFVPGVGEQTLAKLKAKNIHTVQDLLLFLPLRYEDRSHFVKISDLKEGELCTFTAQVTSVSSFYRNHKSIQTANVKDATGSVKLMWFNNKFILSSLKKGETYLFSGQLGKYKSIIQAKFEKLSADSIHTGRIVPVYSASLDIKIGNLRRILKNIIDHSQIAEKWLFTLHFPDQESDLIAAREQIAVEELLSLIHTAQQLKNKWQAVENKFIISAKQQDVFPALPFTLTNSQQQAVTEILENLAGKNPMNRLLIGDVGSGKTIVAALVARQVLAHQLPVALIAPTKMLAQQHRASLKKIFPDLDWENFHIGTHRIINQLAKIKPALIIYDEQHKFGVSQRSPVQNLKQPAHILTMSATPIPRSMMLTIFAHLSLSKIETLPQGKDIQTFLLSDKKRADNLEWLSHQSGQSFYICPFINQSTTPGFESIAAATDKYLELKKILGKKLRVALLHGRLPQDEQEKIAEQLYQQQIDLLVTTPIVEVGIDLPQAQNIIIENAERFGLASLHQLRGRVGRAGQKAYCFLYSNSKKKERLKYFCQEKNGFKLAEYDLKHRGAGNIFGTQQHGFDELKFADWTNLELIAQARQKYEEIKNTDYHFLFAPRQTAEILGN